MLFWLMEDILKKKDAIMVVAKRHSLRFVGILLLMKYVSFDKIRKLKKRIMMNRNKW